MHRLIVCLFFLPLASLALPSLALEDEEERVLIAKERIIPGNYYYMGESIEIDGTVEGDAFLIGSRVVIKGVVKGNLRVIGGDVILLGKVEGKTTLLALQAEVGGVLDKKASLFCVNGKFLPSSTCGQGLFLMSGYTELGGYVRDKVVALSGGLEVSGVLQNDLQTFVGRLKIASKGRIAGDLQYRSHNDANIEEGAKIEGAMRYNPSLLRAFEEMPLLGGVVVGSKVAVFFMNFLYTFAAGALLIRFFPDKLSRTLHVLQKRPFQILGYGIFLLFLLPLLSLVLLISIVGTPLALTLLALNVIGFYTVKIFPILWVSNAMLRRIGWKPNTLPTLATGQVFYYLLCLLPWIGWLISFFCMLLGFGASFASQLRREKR